MLQREAGKAEWGCNDFLFTPEFHDASQDQVIRRLHHSPRVRTPRPPPATAELSLLSLRCLSLSLSLSLFAGAGQQQSKHRTGSERCAVRAALDKLNLNLTRVSLNLSRETVRSPPPLNLTAKVKPPPDGGRSRMLIRNADPPEATRSACLSLRNHAIHFLHVVRCSRSCRSPRCSC